MGTYKQFQTSTEHEKEGVWLDLDDAGSFKLARAGGGNKRYQKRLEALMKPYRRAIQTETLSDEKANELLRQVFADAVILDWEGVTGPDGKPLECTRENVIQLLTDLPDLFATIRDTAQNESVYRQHILEEDSGNSEPSSDIS